MNAVSPVRALVAYYWNTWYFLAAVFGAVSSLLLGAWISSAANGTPITGGYCVYFTATQPLICLSLLFACDARVAKAHYGGLPRHVYSAWTPCSLRAVFRALILTSVNLIGVLCFDAIMVLTGTGIHPHLAAVLCFPDLLDRRDRRRSQNRRNRLGHPLLCMDSPAGRPSRLCDALRRERPTDRRT